MVSKSKKVIRVLLPLDGPAFYRRELKCSLASTFCTLTLIVVMQGDSKKDRYLGTLRDQSIRLFDYMGKGLHPHPSDSRHLASLDELEPPAKGITG